MLPEVRRPNPGDHRQSLRALLAEEGCRACDFALAAAVGGGAMNVEDFLSRLQNVQPRGPGRYMARCLSHEDVTPSLSVRECEDGTILVKCFAGCSAADIVEAAGLKLEDLFPDKPADYSQPHQPRRRPRIDARDVIAAIRHDLVCFALACEQMARGELLSEADCETLMNSYYELMGFLSEIEDVA